MKEIQKYKVFRLTDLNNFDFLLAIRYGS